MIIKAFSSFTACFVCPQHESCVSMCYLNVPSKVGPGSMEHPSPADREPHGRSPPVRLRTAQSFEDLEAIEM